MKRCTGYLLNEYYESDYLWIPDGSKHDTEPIERRYKAIGLSNRRNSSHAQSFLSSLAAERVLGQGFPMLSFAACGGWEKRKVRGHLALRQRGKPLCGENWKALRARRSAVPGASYM